MSMATTNSRTFTCLSDKTISWTLSMLYGITADFGVPVGRASSMLAPARLNLFTQNLILIART